MVGVGGLSVDALKKVNRDCNPDAGDDDAPEKQDKLEANNRERVPENNDATDEKRQRDEESDNVHRHSLPLG